ncbi:hypothetical protein Egran_07061 [Elaphomyces granulatus]|uniref:TLC domain-containing protein n=1 Tax=Elaphomyces granulatus TaxID=519963 RepID=A0A232LLZ0_9EURO|nr:hypothetical protein Egran_07061 [Elaphomyces granulatus]
MLDPFPPPPLWLKESVEPWATYFRLATLPEHVHEILFAFAFYMFIQFYLSPRLSTYFFPQFYLNFPRRTQLNWDVHIVSFVQSTLITILAIWITIADQERWDMTSGGRVYGYTGACGLIQALATGYFLYDLVVSTLYFDMFGVGMFFHAISALWVYSQGFVSIYFLFLPFLHGSPSSLNDVYTTKKTNQAACFLPRFRDRSLISMPQHSSFMSSPALSSTSIGFWIR